MRGGKAKKDFPADVIAAQTLHFKIYFQLLYKFVPVSWTLSAASRTLDTGNKAAAPVPSSHLSRLAVRPAGVFCPPKHTAAHMHI